MSTYYHNLYTFTLLELRKARRLLKLGQNECAREKLRYIQNSQVIDVLKSHQFPSFLHVDVSLMEWELQDALMKSVFHCHRWVSNRESEYRHIVVEERCRCGAHRHHKKEMVGRFGPEWGTNWYDGKHPDKNLI